MLNNSSKLDLKNDTEPNILLLVLDAMPHDRFFNKNKTSCTPNIDKLINSGSYFTQAISSTDGTFASLGSLFTSLYPFSSNIDWFTNHKKARLFFSYFKEKNYKNIGILPDTTFWKTLSSNFDDREIIDVNYYFGLEEGLGKTILKKFDSISNLQPWVFYIHLMDLHDRKSVPENFNDKKFGSDEYDQLISYIDFWIGKILEKIDLTKTLVVITSDHGNFISDLNLHPAHMPRLTHNFTKIKKSTPNFLEPLVSKFFIFILLIIKKMRESKMKNKLNEDQKRTLLERGKSYLYDEVVRIPLLFSGYHTPKKLINQQVRQIDVFPTISDIVGLPKIDQPIDGKSLLPLINGENMSEEPALIENMSTNPKKPGKFIGIRTSTYKFFKERSNQNNNYLFNLKNDPNEKNNIVTQNPELVQKMENMLTELRNNEYEIPKNSDYESIDEIKDELKKLGYI